MTTETRPKPQPPTDGECCGGGCSPCIWDFYYEELTEWQKQQAQSAPKTEQDED